MFLMASAICWPLVLKEATVWAMAPEKAEAHCMSVMSAMMGRKLPYPVVNVLAISWVEALVALAVRAAMEEKTPTASSECCDRADLTSYVAPMNSALLVPAHWLVKDSAASSMARRS